MEPPTPLRSCLKKEGVTTTKHPRNNQQQPTVCFADYSSLIMIKSDPKTKINPQNLWYTPQDKAMFKRQLAKDVWLTKMTVSASSAGGSDDDEQQGGCTTPVLSDEEMCRGVGLEQMLDPRGVLTSRRQHTNTIIMAQDKYGINSERLRQLSMISSNYNRHCAFQIAVSYWFKLRC